MLHSSHPPTAVSARPATSLLAAFLTREPSPRASRQPGQGLVEYSLILVLIAIGTIGVLSMLGRETANVFTEVNCSVNGGEWRADNGNGNSNRCVGARTGNGRSTP